MQGFCWVYSFISRPPFQFRLLFYFSTVVSTLCQASQGASAAGKSFLKRSHRLCVKWSRWSASLSSLRFEKRPSEKAQKPLCFFESVWLEAGFRWQADGVAPLPTLSVLFFVAFLPVRFGSTITIRKPGCVVLSCCESDPLFWEVLFLHLHGQEAAGKETSRWFEDERGEE